MTHLRAILGLDEMPDDAVQPLLLDGVEEPPHLLRRRAEHETVVLVEDGIDAALERKEREKPTRAIKFDGKFEAELTRLACSAPPACRARWPLRLLRDRLIEMNVTDTVSTMTLCNMLKKTRSNPT